MHHSYIDKYASLDSPVHRIDPRVKIISSLLIVLGIVFTRPCSSGSFFPYFFFLCALIFLSKIPPSFIFARSLAIIPFVFMIALFIPFIKEGEVAGAFSFGRGTLSVTHSGLAMLWNVLFKSYLSIVCIIVLSASTKFSVLLKSLEKLKVPPLFIMVLSFMYRYIFVIIDETMHMKRAKNSRTVGGNNLLHAKVLANMLGSLFIRSYERAESIYLAMRSRGFSGTINTLHRFTLSAGDMVFMGIVILFISTIHLLGYYVK